MTPTIFNSDFHLVWDHYYIWLQVYLLLFCLKIALGVWELSLFSLRESLKLVISNKSIAVCKYHYNKYENTPYITKISKFLPMALLVWAIVNTTNFRTWKYLGELWEVFGHYIRIWLTVPFKIEQLSIFLEHLLCVFV